MLHAIVRFCKRGSTKIVQARREVDNLITTFIHKENEHAIFDRLNLFC